MIKANLYRDHVIGDIVNLRGKAYRIVADSGKWLDCFPGGKGIREVSLEQISERPLTDGEKARFGK